MTVESRAAFQMIFGKNKKGTGLNRQIVRARRACLHNSGGNDVQYVRETEQPKTDGPPGEGARGGCV